MPRYTLTPEEFAHVERLRAKNANTLGYNEGLEQAATVAVSYRVGGYEDETPGQAWLDHFVDYLRSLKRELS